MNEPIDTAQGSAAAPGGPEAARTRVLVVDDHDLFRTGLATLLEAQPDIEVIGQASGGRAGVRLALELRPDVVLMDIRMPDLQGSDATRAILKQAPEIRIVVLTVVHEATEVARALEAGACGFLAKETRIEDIAVAVRAASQGAAWLSPRAAEVVLQRLRQTEPGLEAEPSPSHQLSARELEVLRLVAEGMENAEIAVALKISPRTAKNHVSNILAKLSVSSRVQAAIFALRSGLVQDSVVTAAKRSTVNRS
jgi:NarL family two-component system response regulator LiaR